MKVRINQAINETNRIRVNGAHKPISVWLVREEGDKSQNIWIMYSEIFRELMKSGEARFFAGESVGWLPEYDDFSPLQISLQCDENDYTQLSNYIDHLPALDVIRADLQIKLEAIKAIPDFLHRPYSVSCEYSNATIKADFLSRIERVEGKLDNEWNQTFFAKHLPNQTMVKEQFGKPETLSNQTRLSVPSK